MLNEPYLTQIGRTIQLSVASVFLLTAIGTTIAVLTNRLARIVDRARILEEERMASAPAEGKVAIHSEIATLSRRAQLINLAITLGTVCALLICDDRIYVFWVIFVTRSRSICLDTFCNGHAIFYRCSFAFLREIFIAVKTLRIGMT
jgi:hypothetical protein